MKRTVMKYMMLILLIAVPAHGENAMKYFDLGIHSSMTRVKIEYFTRALELDPKLAEAYQKRGMLYYFQEEYEKVIQDFSAFIEIAAANADAYTMLGIGYLKKGIYQPAIHYFNRAIEMDPEHVRAYANRSEAYRLMGEDREAINDATRATELNGDPRSKADAYRTRFKIYWELDQLKLALADYRKSVELDPSIVLWRYPDKKYPSPEEVSHAGLLGLIGIAFVLIFGTRLKPPDK